MTSTDLADKMPLTQEKRLDSNFANNNDHSYLHKKFKKMATTIAVFPPNISMCGDIRQKDTNLTQSTCGVTISNGSIAAAHPEIEKIKENRNYEDQNAEKNVQINLSEENSRLSYVNNVVQVSGQTSSTNEFSNKTENLENDFIRGAYNGNVGGAYICPYCKISCAKPSVLEKHIRAHTNERPFPCVPCGFAFKTKSNLYKHKRSRTHALRLKGADVPITLNEEDFSGGSESDTSIPPTSLSEAGSDSSTVRMESYETNRFSPESSESMGEGMIHPLTGGCSNSRDSNKFKSLYKPKFRAAFYPEPDAKDKVKRSMSSNADFLTEHISKIISDNEAIVDVIDTPLQKKYGKIKQIAESKQLSIDADVKPELSPLNLSKYNYEIENNFRKRSHSESFSQNDHHKHPLNPEGSIIKDLLLKSKLNGFGNVTELLDGSIFVCPLCQIIFRSADNLETHRTFYCKGNITNTPVNVNQKEMKNMRPDNVYIRSNSVNVRLPESPPNTYLKTSISNKSPHLRMKPENLVITKQESNDVAAPLPSPGPLLGNTRLVDTRTNSDYHKQKENMKLKPMPSPKRKFESRSDTYSPRLSENVSPRSNDLYIQPKLRCMDPSIAIRSLEDLSPHMRHNTTSLQMFGGEVKIVDQSGSTTTLRIEPNKNQLSPILIHRNLSPSKIANDPEASSIVVRSGLHSGGTLVHNPPTPKETLGTPQPQTPRITMSSASATNNSLPNIHDRTHFQFPPLSAITAFNPLTLPPLSPSASTPNGATTIFHGGKLIPHVPGIPGPNTPGLFVNHGLSKHLPTPNEMDNCTVSKSGREEIHSSIIPMNMQHVKASNYLKYENQQLPVRSSQVILTPNEQEKNNHDISSDGNQFITTVPIIKVKHVDEPKFISQPISKHMSRQEGSLKRTMDTIARIPVLKENMMHYSTQKCKREKLSSPLPKTTPPMPAEIKTERDIRNFNFENLITKAEIFNKIIPSSSEVQKNNNGPESPVSIPNERSETFYFQKNVSAKSNIDDRKPKFLRPSTLPLKPGTFTPKKHHGITPNANTMPLVSPETPRPAKAYGQLYLNGNAYTYLGLKCSTKVFYCTINRPQPTYVPNQHFLSMYSNWQLLSELTPDPLGLSASSAMSLYDSRHRPQTVSVAVLKQDLILTHSSQWNKISTDSKQTLQCADVKKFEENKYLTSENVSTSKKELTGGFESNEEYTYVRGRGRGRYVCSECGIRCKKPSMLKKHIRTHTDVRPYTCIHCAFSFKTKGNLTKHMKSKAHYKKCCELGINPNEGQDVDNGELTQCSGETDDDTESDGDEGNEGETESDDTEVCKSRLPEHEAAHCLLSLGGSRPNTSSTPGLITSARPSTYPYTPTGQDNCTMEIPERVSISRSMSVESRQDTDNEPMDLSKTDVKSAAANVPEIPTARESSVLASLASNTAKLPQHQSQWSNGEPMLQTYLTERALLDSKIKQSQLTCNFSKLRKVDMETSTLKSEDKLKTTMTKTTPTPVTSPQMVTNMKISSCIDVSEPSVSCVSKEEVPTPIKELPIFIHSNSDVIRHNTTSTSSSSSCSNTENAKHVVSEYLKHARINLIKTHEENLQNHTDNVAEDNSNNISNEDSTKIEEVNASESDSLKLPSLDHEPVARKVVIGVGGVAFKVTKGKDFENSSYPPGRLMEDGRRVCDFCNKSFTKPSQLKLHLNIHYMERPFRCGVCAVSFRTRGHLQKHERSGSHHNKVSMTSTFGAATSFNPRPFRCSDCNIAFRIHGHLAKHLRSKMHVMRLECLFKLPFGTFTEIERAGVSLTDIDTTDCASSLASLQSLAKKLHEKDPTKLEYREPAGAGSSGGMKESSDEEEALGCDNLCESDKDSEVKTVDTLDGQDNETRVNYSATDI